MRRPLLAVCSLAVVCGVSTAPATAQIVLPGTQPGDLVNWPLIDPGNCRTCHGGYIAGLDYEPFDTWSGSMMANSGRDPLFWAAVDIANQDVPGIGELCIRCHSPKGWLAGRSSTPDGSALLGFPDEEDNDFDGVDCHFCHRMYEGPSGTPFTENGQYFVDDGTPTQEPPRRGPYAITFAPHPTTLSTYHESSEFCGTCHDLRNPLVELLDGNGIGTGQQFPEQLTYTEWANSAFAAEGTSCQECHMPEEPTNPAYACNSFNPPRPDLANGDSTGVDRHDLAGANTFIPKVLKGEYGFQLNREAAYDYTIMRAMDMLQNQSATVVLTPPGVAVDGDSMTVDVRVTNLTGHKLPTGYPEGRRMWLHVEATDALGAPFFESGAYDDSTAQLIVDPQLRLYATDHGQHGQGPGFHLALNDRIFTDTRIPPRGFMPVAGSEPLGRVYPVQPDGSLAYFDDVRYRIAVPSGIQGPVQVYATLRYQTTTRSYVEFLRDNNVSGPDPKDRNFPAAPSRGQKIYDLWQSYGRSAPVDMVQASAQIPVVPVPANVGAMTAVAGHNHVALSWNLPPAAAGLKLLRKGWMDYPEFGSASSVVPAPVSYARIEDALADGWIEIYDGFASSLDDSSFSDLTRQVATYAAYAYDSNGVFARLDAVSQARATSYRLGDMGEVGNPGVYDGNIDGALDLPVFSLAYGSSEGQAGWNPEADIAPTDDLSSTGIPVPDDVVDFQDLIAFSLQFGSTEAAKSIAAVSAREDRIARGGLDAIELVVGQAQKEDGRFRLPLSLRSEGASLRGFHLVLDRGLLGADLLAVEGGALMENLGGRAFQAVIRRGDRIEIDAAALGADRVIAAHGHLLDLFLSTDVDLVRAVRGVELRAPAGEELPVTVRAEESTAPSRPRALVALSANVPNPFNPRTRLELRLERAGFVELAVFDLAGRRVKTLLRGPLEAGSHEILWNGTDDQDREVASGIYLARATAHGVVSIRRMALIR